MRAGARVVAWALRVKAGLAPRIAASGVATALGLAVAGAIVFTDASATAKTHYDSPYGYDKTWNAALRMVRVDLELKVLEKDDVNGYLLFDYKSPEAGVKSSNGSIEFIKSRDPRSHDVRVIVQLPQMPRYHEQALLDRLARKMRDEYGDPPAPRKDLPPAADAGVDSGESN